ncbi:hypothetical protein F5Y14DRAFT_454787 [Nemania sp. NC0429]|nr:hypothetical protein F5Y14DRAFT_454787 [Nemania sp. NC0429]
MPLDPRRGVSTVVAFAKWSHPVLPGEDYAEPPWSKASGSPLYWESTVEAALFYEKTGFPVGETISLPIYVDGGTEAQTYEEVVLTYYPA